MAGVTVGAGCGGAAPGGKGRAQVEEPGGGKPGTRGVGSGVGPGVGPGVGSAMRRGVAHYVLTERVGAIFDTRGGSAALRRPEPALYEGKRFLLKGGMILATAPSSVSLSGFSSVPERLGGGYLLWSREQVYRATTFLGPLSPIASVSVHGAQPWLDGMLLTTSSGSFLLDLRAPEPALRPLRWPGTAQGIALDTQRAARVDVLGRAAVTLDGGATWRDLLATKGVMIRALTPGDGLVVLHPAKGGHPLLLTAEGLVDERKEVALSRSFRPDQRLDASVLLPAPLVVSSRSLAPELVQRAVATGGVLPWGGALATAVDEARVSLLSAAGPWPLQEVGLPQNESGGGRCQAVIAGEVPLVACFIEKGGMVLRLTRALGEPSLEATFPERGRFFAGQEGAFAYAGRCSPSSPSAADLFAASAPSPSPVPLMHSLRQLAVDETPEPEEPPVPPPADEARVCVRDAEGRWSERQLVGDDARRLYRWIPGPSGVTALVAGGEGKREGAAPAPVGVRVVRVRAGDPALKGGQFLALGEPELAERFVESDFWEDEDRSIRGWIELPEDSAEERDGEARDDVAEEERESAEVQGLPETTTRGGRAAGVRIDASGRVTVLSLPKGVTSVVHGGRFALARTEETEEAKAAYFESTDGGASWQPIEGPPVGRLEAPSDTSGAFGCSTLGCSLSDGLVRVGWGGAAPAAPTPPDAREDDAVEGAPGVAAPAQLRPGVLSCRLEKDGVSRLVPPTPAAPPTGGKAGGRAPSSAEGSLVSLASSGSRPMGTLEAGSAGARWSAEILQPFAPGGRPRRLTVRGAPMSRSWGSVAPILMPPGSPEAVDMLLMVERHATRAGERSPSFSLLGSVGHVAAAALLAGERLLVLDTLKDGLLLSGPDGARVALGLTWLGARLGARLTLAARRDGQGLALVSHATSSGELLAGGLDVGRAEVGPLAVIGQLGSLEESEPCQVTPGSLRFVVESPVVLRISTADGAVLREAERDAVMLVTSSGGRLCAEGVEARVPGADEDLLIRARFGPRAAGEVRSGRGSAYARCTLDPGRVSAQP
ncbi:uncharacterized protein CMC5_062310 [Chondromyces crocatus]|uniref:Uncharacterized protein n=2 Tax=Chondromyces crocatus TaxID=52 RepID=A0A0K1EMC0_CHOCO|nr:uncharacterized protein CMC5_062310 [Chondromyces crocatus]